MQGSVRALKAAPKLHNYSGTRNKNSDTQKYTHINNINMPSSKPKTMFKGLKSDSTALSHVSRTSYWSSPV